VLFRSYCICLYDAALWNRYHVGAPNKLRSCYNRCIKLFLGFNRRDSLPNILFNLGLPSFDTVMANAAVSYWRLWNGCNNRVFCMYAIYLCIIHVHFIPMFPLFCVFVFCVLLYVTSVWALLPDLKLMTMIAVCLMTMTLTVKSEIRSFVQMCLIIIVFWQ